MRTLQRLFLSIAFVLTIVTPSWAVSLTGGSFAPNSSLQLAPTDASVAVAEEGSNSWRVVDENELIAVYKNGSAQTTWNTNTGTNFWHDVFSNCDDTAYSTACNGDPRIIYDPTDHANNGHWIVMANNPNIAATTSYLYIAVSRTGDPTGAWWKWRTSTACSLYSSYPIADFSRVAINYNWITITASCINSSGITIGDTEIHVFSRAGNGTYTCNDSGGCGTFSCSNTPPATGGGHCQPGCDHTAPFCKATCTNGSTCNAVVGMEGGESPADLGSSTTGAPYTTSDNLPWEPMTDRTVTTGLLYFVEPVPAAGAISVNLYSIGIDGSHNPTGITKTCPMIDPNCATDGTSSSGSFTYMNTQVGPGINGGTPRTPSASKTYWLNSNDGPCPPNPSNPSLNTIVPNGDMDTWANGDTVLEWTWNGKYGGTSNSSSDGGAYVVLWDYDINPGGGGTWTMQPIYNGDTSGTVEETYPSVAHELVGSHDYQILVDSYMGAVSGSTVDSTMVRVFKDKNPTAVASQSYPFNIGTNVVCGRWGDYSAVAPDACGTTGGACTNSANNLEWAAMAQPDQSHAADMYGNVSLP